MAELTTKHCVPCEGGVPKLDKKTAQKLLDKLDGWDIQSSGNEIVRSFHFKDYYQTIAFVNAIAWISHHENHHPDLEVSYNHCLVKYSTHAIGGLSENDFICAAKIDKLYKQ